MNHQLNDRAMDALEKLLEAAHYLTHPTEANRKACGFVSERELTEKVREAYRVFERAEEEVAA